MADLKPEDVLDDETLLSVKLRETENRLVQTSAELEAVTAALNGEPVSDFMSSFPAVMLAQALYGQSKRAGSIALWDFGYEGEYTTATLTMSDGTVGSGTSRKREKALSYALEDLAQKVRNA